ncbi:MAG: hypothetical protein ABII23_01700 [bacterium]
MFCPSCEKQMPDMSSYCGRCGMFLNKTSSNFMKLSINIGWILRRSMGGFAAGAVAWVFAMAVSRTVGIDSGPGLHEFLLCVITGIFLGTVGGIIEDSSYKAFLGGILGCAGGIIGAFVSKIFAAIFSWDPLSTVSFIPAWIVVGMFIGANSGIVEKSTKKIMVGILVGMLGGALGGFIGVEMYGSLAADFVKTGVSWSTVRGVELFSGGIFGATFWLVLGIVQKLYIFKRRLEPKMDKKICDTCKAQSPLNYWYCIKCGAALQVEAPREKIKVTPFRALERTINAFRFMSWLFGAAGIITSCVIFVVFLISFRSNPLFAFLVGLSIALLSYLLVVLFSFMSDMLSSLVKITDSLEPKPQ